jgi:mono/diheme cytochrome c family protein
MRLKRRHGYAAAVGLVAVLVLFIVIAMIRRGFSARAEPSALEAVMARTMRSMAVPTKAKKMRNPLPASPGSIRVGMEHFADHCATCHANNGSGDTDFGRGMYPKPPDMRADPTQSMTDGEIYHTIRNGVRLTGMPAFGDSDRDDDEETWNLVHFIRHLPRLTPEEEKQMEQWNPKSQAGRSEETEEEQFLSGQDKPAKHDHR